MAANCRCKIRQRRGAAITPSRAAGAVGRVRQGYCSQQSSGPDGLQGKCVVPNADLSVLQVQVQEVCAGQCSGSLSDLQPGKPHKAQAHSMPVGSPWRPRYPSRVAFRLLMFLWPDSCCCRAAGLGRPCCLIWSGRRMLPGRFACRWPTLAAQQPGMC